ncbi:GNAT family N-acetyltransferase [Paenibacillus agricola]|uniref:GNAT family N-acetyltransferase n=1 Tax=Paenibacillus agricola TaxID=2716264 RepID=A0ABX0J9V5_9BACL|nr:GNAT family N-acetyltransferase [Paenibacillus agricola]NHN30761.1 GNAT family N-acetyltransferase [Paenibacillus agricola]
MQQEIERYAYHTWPAATTLPYGDWILRASGGITKRANSVWTASGNEMPQGDWLREVEQFYKTQNLPACYHISDASPKGIEASLEVAGYSKLFPCSVLVADTKQVIQLSSYEPKAITIHFQPLCADRWLSDFLRLEGFSMDKYDFYSALFSRITQLKSFCSLYLDGECIAIGTAVVENGWAGFTNIAVKAELRGQGIGRLLLHSLAQWSQSHGADRLYLQVLDNNRPAHRLYHKSGFSPLFHYHYRVKD